ncbi:MAG: FHA domain-containing protein, partial [Ancalomicrobiaceae bacterium]|nr:FHA domain-containing protein [Ancalomicrobiaceae bacterium]
PRPVMTPPVRPAAPIAPQAAPLAPTPIAASPVGPNPLAPSPIAPTPAAPAPVAAAPIAAAPIRQAPAAATPSPAALSPAPTSAPASEPISSPRVASLQPFQMKQPATGVEETSLISGAGRAADPGRIPAAKAPETFEPTVGWLVVVKGPGRGASRPIVAGRNALGSASDQPLSFGYGDQVIVPRGHVFVVYDEEARQFYVEDGKQKEIARLNGRLLTETRELSHGDDIRIGSTTFRFVALCGPEFDWADDAMPKPSAEPALAPKPQPAAASAPASSTPSTPSPAASAPSARAPAAATPLTGSVWGEPEVAPAAEPEPEPHAEPAAPTPSGSHASPFDDFAGFRPPEDKER